MPQCWTCQADATRPGFLCAVCMATLEASNRIKSKHTFEIDAEKGWITIRGNTETMDSIPESEIEAACTAAGVRCTWDVVDETTYRVVQDATAATISSHDQQSVGGGDRLQDDVLAASAGYNPACHCQVCEKLSRQGMDRRLKEVQA
jgi:hypothetical protein